MKKITIEIRISEESQKVAWIIKKNNTDESATATLEIAGVLDLIKKAELEKLGEVLKKREEIIRDE